MMKSSIRWMIRRDMPEVLDIESKSFKWPWGEREFLRCLRQRNCIGTVAEYANEVVGFMIHELHKTRLHVLNFAVDPRCLRRRIGTQMVDNLKSRLSEERRSRILLEIRDGNLTAQLFFRAQGFKAVSIMRNFYEDTEEDAYLFQYRYGQLNRHKEEMSNAKVR